MFYPQGYMPIYSENKTLNRIRNINPTTLLLNNLLNKALDLNVRHCPFLHNHKITK